MSGLFPFQKATVEVACNVLLAPAGPRRFLVADEVGLGKTLVAREVVRRLVERSDGLIDVLYVCSSQAIAAQNLRELARAAPGSCLRPRVDRLTLWPSVYERARREAKTNGERLQLVAFTPGTSFNLRSAQGTYPERHFIYKALAQHYGWRSKHAEQFRGTVSEEHWRECLRQEVVLPSRASRFWPRLDEEIGKRFRGNLEEALHQEHLPGVIGRLREAFASIALDFLSPSLVILDEFQRFQGLLRTQPDAHADRKEAVAHTLAQRLLGTAGSEAAPRVLLLSATPFELFSYGWEKLVHGDSHYDEFFEVIRFLANDDARVQEIRRAFRLYHERLLQSSNRDDIDGRLAQARDRVGHLLGQLVARTERALHPEGERLVDDQARSLQFGEGLAPLKPEDLSAFSHARSAVGPNDAREMALYWASIPYPLQMLQGYQIRDKKRLHPPSGKVRQNLVLGDEREEPQPLRVPHPKFRALMETFPAERLAVPWLGPSLPWWQVSGPWRSAADSKVLVFSRWRGVPRALSILLSRMVSDSCRGGEPLPEEGARLDFALKDGGPSRSPLFRLYYPCRWLASIVDPLALARALGPVGSSALDSVRIACQKRIREALKGLGISIGHKNAFAKPDRWRLLPAVDARGGLGKTVLQTWRELVQDKKDQPQALEVHVRALEEAAAMPLASIGPADVSFLADVALGSPAVTLLRAVERRFPPVKGAYLRGRLRRIIEIVYGGFGHLLDLPWMRAFLRQRYDKQASTHAARVLLCALDGNLEAVWDEYLWITSRLGGQMGEEDVLGRLKTALDLRVVRGLVDRPHLDSIRLPRHVAQAFLLEGSESIESARGLGKERAFRQDDLRMAFNSPFWPHFLITTSVGQEGLDFHVYCREIVHWNLPRSPVDLEQREGRIQRFGSLAVRRAVAAVHARAADEAGADPWKALFAAAGQDESGLQPYWVYPGATIRRWVLPTPFSEELDDYRRLKEGLLLYRIALGQPDQDDLIEAITEQHQFASDDEARAWVRQNRINLAPWSRL